MATCAIGKLAESTRSAPGSRPKMLAGLVCPAANATTRNREMTATARVNRLIGFDLSAQSGLELGAQEIVNSRIRKRQHVQVSSSVRNQAATNQGFAETVPTRHTEKNTPSWTTRFEKIFFDRPRLSFGHWESWGQKSSHSLKRSEERRVG